MTTDFSTEIAVGGIGDFTTAGDGSLPRLAEQVINEYSYWTEEASKAYRRYVVLKENYRETKARRRQELRTLLSATTTRLSETRLDSEVEADQEVMEARRKYLDADVHLTEVKNRLTALAAKKDMVIALSRLLAGERAVTSL